MAEAGSAKVLKDPDVDLSEWLRHWGTPGLPKLWPGWCHVVPRCPMLAQDGPMLHQGRPQDGFRNAPWRNMGASEDHIGQSRNHFRAILRQDGTTLGSIIKNIEFRYVFSSSRFENVIFQFLIVFGTQLETILGQQEAIWTNIGNFGATLELLGSILGDPETILGLP